MSVRSCESDPLNAILILLALVSDLEVLLLASATSEF